MSATIGQGAVVLTASADDMLKGLDRARDGVEDWADITARQARKAERAIDGVTDAQNRAAHAASGMKGKYDPSVNYVATNKLGGNGGKGGLGGAAGKLFGGLSLGGGTIGAGGGAGAALAGIGVGIQAVTKALELGAQAADWFVSNLTQVGERSKLYGNIGAETQAGIDRAVGAFDRMEAAQDDFFFKAAEKLAPSLEKIADVIERVGYVGAEVFGEIVDVVGEIITNIAQWIDDTFGLATATTSAGDQTFAILRKVGEGVAWVWDTVKVGAGVVAYVAGVIDEGFGEVLKVVAMAARQLDALAKELPEAIRPDWVGKAAEGIEKVGALYEKQGERCQKFGKDAINGFGESAPAVAAWFDKIEAGFAKTDRLQKKWEGQLLGGAFQMNSTEAYSVVTKNNASNQMADAQKRGERLQQEANGLLGGINDKLAKLGVG